MESSHISPVSPLVKGVELVKQYDPSALLVKSNGDSVSIERRPFFSLKGREKQLFNEAMKIFKQDKSYNEAALTLLTQQLSTVIKNPQTAKSTSSISCVFQKIMSTILQWLGRELSDRERIELTTKLKSYQERMPKKVKNEQTAAILHAEVARLDYPRSFLGQLGKEWESESLPDFQIINRICYEIQSRKSRNLPSLKWDWKRSDEGMGCVLVLTVLGPNSEALKNALKEISGGALASGYQIEGEDEDEARQTLWSFTFDPTSTATFLGAQGSSTDKTEKLFNWGETLLWEKKWKQSRYFQNYSKVQGPLTPLMQVAKIKEQLAKIKEQFETTHSSALRPIHITANIDEQGRACFIFTTEDQANEFVQFIREETDGCIALPSVTGVKADDEVMLTLSKKYTDLLMRGTG